MSRVVKDVVDKLIDEGEIPIDRRDWATEELETEMDRHLILVLKKAANDLSSTLLHRLFN